MKNQSAKKGPRLSTGGAGCGATSRRLSVGGTMVQTQKPDFLHPTKATPNTRQAKKNNDSLHHHHNHHPRLDGFTALPNGGK